MRSKTFCFVWWSIFHLCDKKHEIGVFLEEIQYVFAFLSCRNKQKTKYIHFIFFFHSLFFFLNTHFKRHVHNIPHAEPDETFRLHFFLFPGLPYTRMRILRYKVLNSGADFISCQSRQTKFLGFIHIHKNGNNYKFSGKISTSLRISTNCCILSKRTHYSHNVTDFGLF